MCVRMVISKNLLIISLKYVFSWGEKHCPPPNQLLVLRKSRLVCHVTGQWMGSFLYADDLSLIAPSCAILARMLEMVAE